MIYQIALLSIAVGLARFCFKTMPARLDDPFVWYVTLAHFWIGALVWTMLCRRFTKSERWLAFGCFLLLTILELVVVFHYGMQEFNPPK